MTEKKSTDWVTVSIFIFFAVLGFSIIFAGAIERAALSPEERENIRLQNEERQEQTNKWWEGFYSNFFKIFDIQIPLGVALIMVVITTLIWSGIRTRGEW